MIETEQSSHTGHTFAQVNIKELAEGDYVAEGIFRKFVSLAELADDYANLQYIFQTNRQRLAPVFRYAL